VTRTFDVVDEDLVTEHTVDISRVITEEDTTERSKGANEVGLEGDGSFNAVDIVSGLENDRPTRSLDSRCLFLGSVSHVERVSDAEGRRSLEQGRNVTQEMGGMEPFMLCLLA
jgi:hypothetical protein